MRTLLIDNYDSYTYNLFQLVAEVNGTEPVVITNDSPSFQLTDLDSFDNVVISPGPGHPARSGDFGISADVIAHARLPILGVCLGHQGIAVAAGAPVVSAPEARHGHLTQVRHTKLDLFRGLPQDFTAVRYHSLCVPEPLPASLEATAWAEDGVVMGLRHRTRPLWGVQFHPESVATRFGPEMIANFLELTAEYQARAGRPAGTPRRLEPAATARRSADPQPARSTRSGPVRYRLHVRRLDRQVPTEAVFSTLFSAAPRAFWLDSAHVEPGLARFSFLGDASGPLAESVSYRVGSGLVEVCAGDAPVRQHPGSIFDYLQGELARRSVDGPTLPFDFGCGYVGFFGYELKADCGSPNLHRAESPDACWLFADRMVAVDHADDSTYLLALSDPARSDGAPASAADADSWLDRTATILDRLPMPASDLTTPGSDRATGQDPVVPALDRAVVERALTRPRQSYLAEVAACQRELLAGESYEICLTNSVRLPADTAAAAPESGVGPGYPFYQRLRRVNPAPYAAYLRLDGVEVACSSPERFLRVDRDGTVESKPIKGTAPRGRTPAEDEQLRDALTTSAKTRAENLMIVDLLRNDLGRVCEVGSVHVPRLMVTETYATVHQLVSTVRGQLPAGTDVISCVRACFPGGSMTGAPKLRTMQIIDSLETEARGVYSGAIGYLSCTGTADLNIVIRTSVLVDDEWRVGAGGAIVLDSDPVEEYEEMLLKAAAPLRAYRPPAAGSVDRSVTADQESAADPVVSAQPATPAVEQ